MGKDPESQRQPRVIRAEGSRGTRVEVPKREVGAGWSGKASWRRGHLTCISEDGKESGE